MERTLFDNPQTLSEYEAYDREHPDIWREFENVALSLIASGVEHYGAKAIMEVVRFHRTIDSTATEPFKINNNFTAYYARKFMRKYPMYDGFFETRKARVEVAHV